MIKENFFNEFMIVYLLAVLWCIATHLIDVFGRMIFPKLKKNKGNLHLVLEMLLKVFYFSFGLYFFQTLILPKLHDVLYQIADINGGLDGANWGATLGITLALSLPQLKDKLEYIM